MSFQINIRPLKPGHRFLSFFCCGANYKLSFSLPSSFAPRLLPMQQLLLLNAMRLERVTQCMVSFVSTVLHQVLHQVQTLQPQGQGQPQGQPQAGQHRLKRTIVPMDLTKVAKTVGVGQVPVILFREEPQLAVDKLKKITAKAGVSVEISLTGSCISAHVCW